MLTLTGTDLAFAGTRIKLHVIGAGCSAAHVLVERRTAEGVDVFVGDLVANGSHAWLEIGETVEWGMRLDEIAALRPRRVFPGRGLPGGPELLELQRAYLDDVITAVAAQRPSGEPTDDALARAKQSVLDKHGALRFSVFLDIGLPAEWRRQASQ